MKGYAMNSEARKRNTDRPVLTADECRQLTAAAFQPIAHRAIEVHQAVARILTERGLA